MKLKYYLRGIGIGIVVTTIIFMISLSIHKNGIESQNTTLQATESKTLAEVQKSTELVTEIETPDTEVADTQKANTEVVDIQKVNTEAKEQSDKKKSNKKKKDKNNSKAKKKVRFEIAGGEYSDVICEKLVEAGLVDDAEAFNKFLIEKDYDNFILPGVYDIPKDSTYEEIAALLTTKVDGEVTN